MLTALTRNSSLLVLSALTACGNPADASGSSGAGSSGSSTTSTLRVIVNGHETVSSARVRESGIKFGDRLDAVLIADSYQDPSGLPELSMTVIAGARRTGDFEIVFNQNKIAREGGSDLAIVSLQVGGEDPLAGMSGTLHVDTLDTNTSGANHSIVRLTGSFEGSFRPEGGAAEVPVLGAFDYIADSQ